MEETMMMDVDDVTNLESIVQLKPDTITKACALAFKSHLSNKPYLVTPDKPGLVFISFPAAWSVADFYSNAPFGLTKINHKLFPSLKSVGLDESANVNQSFQTRFDSLLHHSDLNKEIEKARKKQIVFTGHSSGAALATLATLWLLETRRKSNVANSTNPICLTFGAPLVGDKVFHHAVEREKWSSCFVNFVMKRDIVPRILLAPLSSIEQQFQPILDHLNPNSSYSLPNTSLEEFYMNVMIKASSTVSHTASKLMGCNNMLLGNLASFDGMSSYKPFGTYVFLTGHQTACVLRNTDVVLQILYYCCQVGRDEDICSSISQHMDYRSEELGNSLSNSFINLDLCLENLPLASGRGGSVQVISKVLDDLGVSTRGRICLLAAKELKKQKERNEADINMKKGELIASLRKLEQYKAECEAHKVCYYDAFKVSQDEKDFKANVDRLELAGIWDEIIDLLKIYNLPDNFEGDEEWIQLGTRFRRVMEPLDIANYYRHDKNGDTGPYLEKGRPKRYRFTQRWQEHLKSESSAESCMWAMVEEFRLKGGTRRDILQLKKEICQLEKDIEKWIEDGALSKDIFLEDSTLVLWWKTLGPAHGAASPIRKFMPATTITTDHMQ